MSRELEFRGINKWSDKHEWVYGDLIRKVLGGNIHLFIKPLDDKELEVEYKTVGQYTGLNDCKRSVRFITGQRIYEGDILKSKNGNCFPVIFQDGGFIGSEKDKMYRLNYWSFELSEVIGNIHQNKELLL